MPDSDKSSSVTDTTVDRCDEDCSTKVRNILQQFVILDLSAE